MCRQNRCGLLVVLISAIAYLLFPVDLRSCQCIDRGPTCAWFPGREGPVFMGRVTETLPGHWQEFETRLDALVESLGISDTEDFDPATLDDEALGAFISLFRDYWRGAISSQADQALAIVASVEEVNAWEEEFLDDDLEPRIVRFHVTEVFSGDIGLTFELRSGLGSPGDCSPPFLVGDEYLVFAHGEDGNWSTSGCAGTRETEFAEADLEDLRGYESSPTTARMLGVFYCHAFDPSTHRYSTDPINGAEVIVQNDEQVWKTMTGPDGFFEVPDLPPGDYRVSGEYLGWEVIERHLWGRQVLRPAPVSRTVDSRACGWVDLMAYRERGKIVGRLLDYQNRPLADVGVDLVSATGEYLSQSVQSDTRGRFEFDRVEPGAYLVGMNINRPPSADKYDLRPYSARYYPGVSGRDKALRVFAVAGDAADIGDLQIGPPLNLRPIRGRVLRVDDGSLEDVWVELQQAGYGPSNVDMETVDSQDGSFILYGFEGFDYSIVTHHSDEESEQRREVRTNVSTDGDQEIVIPIPPFEGPDSQ